MSHETSTSRDMRAGGAPDARGPLALVRPSHLQSVGVRSKSRVHARRTSLVSDRGELTPPGSPETRFGGSESPIGREMLHDR